eukprot:gene1403-12023_t
MIAILTTEKENQTTLLAIFSLDAIVQPLLAYQSIDGGYEKWNIIRCIFKLLCYPLTIFVIQEEKINKELNEFLLGLQTSATVTKSKSKISEIYNMNQNDCKIFVEDDLMHQIPKDIPHQKVIIIGNESKKECAFNNCTRLFKPLLYSDLILELTPILKKNYSGDNNLLQGLTVLIVEDHRVIQKCLKQMIKKMNPSEVLIASNGVEALTHFENDKKIDLLLTDINMPLMNGYELIEAIKSSEKGRNTKTIFSTGEMNNQEVLEFVGQWKVDDVLLKPITYSTLIASVRNLPLLN